MLDRSTRALIERELQQLDRLRDEYRELLQIRSEDGPELFGRTALSSVLQAFYQGIEGVFQTIAKRIDAHMPSTVDWHRQLLRQMATVKEDRPAVISSGLAEQLRPFLGFRHLARHNYPFVLDWGMMRHLTEELDATFDLFRSEIVTFLEAIGPADDEQEDASGITPRGA